jgi:uncharacterized protein YceH (UPF0502 family)
MIELDAVEARVVGCLIEKEITTPEYYPMTLNALVNGCNQKSNRDPVVTFEEDDVADALDRLRHKQLVTTLTGGGNRVPKFGHRLQEKLNLGRREVALICELLLRGPQTVGELKDRAGRMHRFSGTDEVEHCLAAMEFVRALPRQPGMKEPRWGHLLSGEPLLPASSVVTAPVPGDRSDGTAELRADVEALQQRVDDLERQVARLNQLFS